MGRGFLSDFSSTEFLIFFPLCKPAWCLQTFVNTADIILLVARLEALTIKKSKISGVAGSGRPAASGLQASSRYPRAHPSLLTVLGAGLGRGQAGTQVPLGSVPHSPLSLPYS